MIKEAERREDKTRENNRERAQQSTAGETNHTNKEDRRV